MPSSKAVPWFKPLYFRRAAVMKINCRTACAKVSAWTTFCIHWKSPSADLHRFTTSSGAGTKGTQLFTIKDRNRAKAIGDYVVSNAAGIKKAINFAPHLIVVGA
jgi:hypothetical protein